MTTIILTVIILITVYLLVGVGVAWFLLWAAGGTSVEPPATSTAVLYVIGWPVMVLWALAIIFALWCSPRR